MRVEVNDLQLIKEALSLVMRTFFPVCSARGEVFSNLTLIYSALVLFGQKSGGLDVKVRYLMLLFFTHSFSVTSE